MEKDKKEDKKPMEVKRIGQGPLSELPRTDDTRSYKFKKIKELINGKSK